MICLAVSFFHDLILRDYRIFIEEQRIRINNFPYTPYGIPIVNLENYLVHIKHFTKIKGIFDGNYKEKSTVYR